MSSWLNNFEDDSDDDNVSDVKEQSCPSEKPVNNIVSAESAFSSDLDLKFKKYADRPKTYGKIKSEQRLRVSASNAAEPAPSTAAPVGLPAANVHVPLTGYKEQNSKNKFIDDPANNSPGSKFQKRTPEIKDREKIKRMRGQSSHATWKSEEFMRLRQQFD
eukprot:GHVL01044388.1.p2 GENE.GHVL01044388.1~~GHVL01044388.1.p2  ORF type:complete len:161 (-),score=25.53 GHVL01044388.1:923-1405(-)